MHVPERLAADERVALLWFNGWAFEGFDDPAPLAWQGLATMAGDTANVRVTQDDATSIPFFGLFVRGAVLFTMLQRGFD